jgi:hypothetical protein
LFLGQTLGIVLHASESSSGVDQHQCGGSFRVRRGEQQTDRHTQLHHCDPFTAHVVEHRDDVVDDSFDEATLGVRNRIRRVPLGSNQIWRQNDDSRFKKCTSRGSSHIRSTGNTVGQFTSTSIGPSPTTWYATWPPPAVLAYRVTASSVMSPS